MLSQHKLYISTSDGLYVFDSTNPIQLVKLKHIPQVGLLYEFDESKDGKYLFASKESEGIEIYDIEDIENIKLVTSYGFTQEEGVKWVSIHPTKNYLFIETHHSYLAVVDFGQYYG